MRTIMVILFVACSVPAIFAQATDSVVQTATVTLSSAQLQHLRATPVQLVTAPGSGKLLNLVSIVAQYRAGGTPFAIGAGGDFSLSLGAARINILLPSSGLIDQPANQVQTNSGSHGGPQSSLENQPLMIFDDGDGEWTGGDGTVTITVYYTVVALQ